MNHLCGLEEKDSNEDLDLPNKDNGEMSDGNISGVKEIRYLRIAIIDLSDQFYNHNFYPSLTSQT